MATIDLNSDVGEAFGPWPMGDDADMLSLISSANIACGFHAGDPRAMRVTTQLAAQNGVAIGAHVGYRDLAGFGRRALDVASEDLIPEIIYQIGALQAIAQSAGTTVRYVKPHGALYNTIVHHEAQAHAVIDGIHAFSADIPVMLLPGGVAVDIAEKKGLRVIREAFADRNYNPDGTLVSRTLPNAVVPDPEFVAARVRQVAEDGSITAFDGTVLKVDAESVCVHGDSPDSVALAQSIVKALGEDGIEIKSFL